MELTHELRENAGLQWVLERLSPLSPFGKQAALEEELDNVALAMELWAAGAACSTWGRRSPPGAAPPAPPPG